MTLDQLITCSGPNCTSCTRSWAKLMGASTQPKRKGVTQPKKKRCCGAEPTSNAGTLRRRVDGRLRVPCVAWCQAPGPPPALGKRRAVTARGPPSPSCGTGLLQGPHLRADWGSVTAA